MADTHDTIDGLLAEFRGYSAGMPASYHVTMSWADFRKMLDRLEAAHKRERGDSAKLREAVDAIISGYENADLCDMNYGEWCHDPANVCVNVPLCKAIHEARAVLAATEKEGGSDGNE